MSSCSGSPPNVMHSSSIYLLSLTWELDRSFSSVARETSLSAPGLEFIQVSYPEWSRGARTDDFRPRDIYNFRTSTWVNLVTPDFKKPDGWAKWKRRFEQFLSASGLDKEDEPRQVSTLLYCLGEEVEGVLASTNISEEVRKKYRTSWRSSTNTSEYAGM